MQGHKGESSSNSVPNQVSQNQVDLKMNPTHTHHHHGHNITVNASNGIGMKSSNYASSSSGPVEPEARQLTRKRKATELDVGPSSSRDESSNIFHMPEGSNHVWQSGSENPTPANVISFDPIIPRLQSRARINNSRQQEPLLTNDNNDDDDDTNGLFNFSSRYSSLGLNPETTATAESSSSRAGQPMLQTPPLTRSFLASSRIRSFSSRANRPISSNIISGPGDSPITTPTNISDHRSFVSSHDDIINPVASVGPHRGSSLYSSRRRRELLRRHLLSIDSGAAGGGEGQNGNLFSGIPPPLRAPPSSLQETGVPSVTGLNHQHRHLSRIRDVLDIIRRGEGLRFEDFMMLDQSVLYGMADIHDRHRDMRLDIDNMSYEELLALEERIGNVNTGLKEENVYKHLKLKTYVGVADAEPCCICQEEYKDGDDLGGLDCGHEFHTGCIKQWLLQKNSCPVCKCEASK